MCCCYDRASDECFSCQWKPGQVDAKEQHTTSRFPRLLIPLLLNEFLYKFFAFIVLKVSRLNSCRVNKSLGWSETEKLKRGNECAVEVININIMVASSDMENEACLVTGFDSRLCLILITFYVIHAANASTASNAILDSMNVQRLQKHLISSCALSRHLIEAIRASCESHLKNVWTFEIASSFSFYTSRIDLLRHAKAFFCNSRFTECFLLCR